MIREGFHAVITAATVYISGFYAAGEVKEKDNAYVTFISDRK